MQTNKLINLLKITLLLIPLFVISDEILDINEISYGNDYTSNENLGDLDQKLWPVIMIWSNHSTMI